jgi:hypothetical protein
MIDRRAKLLKLTSRRRNRSPVHILEHGVAGVFQIGVSLPGNSFI